jgi:hypothetical protein
MSRVKKARKALRVQAAAASAPWVSCSHQNTRAAFWVGMGKVEGMR